MTEASNSLERLTVLMGGGMAVYVFTPGDPTIDTVEAGLNAAYPAVLVFRHTITADELPALREGLTEKGIELVDRTRSEDAEEKEPDG